MQATTNLWLKIDLKTERLDGRIYPFPSSILNWNLCFRFNCNKAKNFSFQIKRMQQMISKMEARLKAAGKGPPTETVIDL